MYNDPLLLAPQKQRTSNLPLGAGLFAAAATAGHRDAATSQTANKKNEPDWTCRTCHLVQCPHQKASRCTQPVTNTGWLAREVEKLAHQNCRPGEPAIANHLHCHEKHNQLFVGASDARNRVPERPWSISKLARDRSADAATVGFRDAATSTARRCRNSKERLHDKVRS